MLNDWRISKHGVQIATNSVIEKVDSTDLYLKGQGAVPYGILLWVTGNKSLPFVDRLDVKKSTTGLVRILTDPSLRVKKKGNLEGQVFLEVFALGDAADIEGQSLPTTAEVAVQKARYLIYQLNRKLDDRHGIKTEVFKYKNKSLVSYIGDHDGIIEGNAERNEWSGRKAWLSWRTGSFTWTRTWRNWVSIMWAIILNMLFGKDVARM